MKLSKNKKIVLLISVLGILTTSIVTPILVINNKNNKQEKENSEDLNKINEIIAKIKNKDILIAPNVSTKNQSEIQNAIKNQLKKENQTLNEDDLLKITTNIKSLTLGIQIEVTLIIKVRNTTKKLKINVEKINLLKNSNITNGNFATIFQDSFKNLWATSYGKKLQVLKVNSNGDGFTCKGWSDDNTQGLLKNSNINIGSRGKIFQDFFKNLWIMGINKKLQVLKANSNGDGYVTIGWTDDNTQDLLNGSNINDGNSGNIFQDSFKNLWAMGKNQKLQVLKANSSGEGYENTWVNDNNKDTGHELLKNSNITNGQGGMIFQDSFKNLWAMAAGTKLQVLKANSNGDGYVRGGWSDNTTQGLTNGSNIINGWKGTIFQDSFKNLWVMGVNKKLQVLKVNSSGDGYVSGVWTNDNTKGLLKGSNINNGDHGTIFQDSFKNLWAMGINKKLQVLKVNSNGDGYVTTGWTDVNNTQGLLNGSNIIDGNDGTIFQDFFGNLWTIGSGTKLQVLKANSGGDGYVTTGWTNATTKRLLNGSNINNGQGGMIFQDSFKNLWATKYNKKLQILIANSDNTGYINSWLYEEDKK